MTNVKSGYVEIERGRMFYEVAGSGPAVLLIHGFGVDQRSWEDQFSVFSDRYTTVALDLRGFGMSSIPDGPYRYFDDLICLLDHLSIDRASLVGSSLGARVAFDFAIAHPERTKAIVSADGVPSGFQFNRPPGAKRGPDPRQYQRTLASLSPERQAWLKAIVADYSRWHRQNPDPRVEVDPPAIQRLHDIEAPTLVIVGSDDMDDFHKAADLLAMGIARSRRHVIEGVGHLPNLEAPEEFNRVVLEFLDMNRGYTLSR